MSARFMRATPAYWLAAGLILGAVIPSIAQSLTAGTLVCGSSIQWRSTCGEPAFDLDARHGKAGLQNAQITFSEFQSCLSREAQADAAVVRKGIFDAATRERGAAIEEAAIWGFAVQ